MFQNKIFRAVLFIIGLILFLDGLFLICQNKIHLGTVLPLFTGIIFCIQAIFAVYIRDFLSKHKRLRKIWSLGWIGFSIWLLSLLSFFVYLNHQSQNLNHADGNIDAIIVLGSGLVKGHASPTLALRLDRAAEIAEHHPKALLIVSGGLDASEKHTEAEIMADYLQENFDLDSSKILKENQSTSTDLNLKNSQVILKQHHISLNLPIAIVTSDFHSLRAKAIATRQGYSNVISISAPTPIMTRYNAWLREYFAYLSGWVLGEY